MLRYTYIGAFWLTLVVFTAQGMNISFTLEPDVLRVGEGGSIILSIENGPRNISPPEIPAIDGLRIGTPRAEHGSSIQIVNGQRTERFTLTFRYPLVPLRPGAYTIGPYLYDVNGTQVDLPARTLRVVASRGAEGDARSDLTDLVFARVLIDRNTVYMQEPFLITIAIYSRGVNLGRDINLMDMPDTGLTITPFQELRSARELVNQKIYDVRRFQAVARGVYSGVLTFAPTLRVQLLVQRSPERQHDLFSTFFSGMEAHPLELKTAPEQVTVRPLPADTRPDLFSGGVGNFHFDVKAKPTTVRVGDPITLQITVAGEGNIDAVGAPSVAESEEWRVYPARLMNQEINNTQNSGRKIFEQIIIPRKPDISAIPALEFSYFNPREERYERIIRGPFPLTITGGEPATTRVVRGDPEQSGPGQTRILGSDIRYLKTNNARGASRTSWYRHPAFLGLQVLPPLLVLAVFAMARHKKKVEGNIAFARRIQAPKHARSGIKKAMQAARTGNQSAYYDAVWQAITSYFGHRLNLAPGEVGMHTIGAALTNAEMGPESIRWLEQWFAQCEQARYANSGAVVMPDQRQIEKELSELEEFLKKCERVSW